MRSLNLASLTLLTLMSGLIASPARAVDVPIPAPPLKNDLARQQAGSQSEEEAGYGKTYGVAGPVTIGPSLTLLSFPHPIQIGIEGKYRDSFGFALNYGFIPDQNVSSTKVNINSLDLEARWFPFHGAFFLGVAVGTQNVNVMQSLSVSGSVAGVNLNQNVNANVQVQSTFYTPELGWRWVWNSGFLMGVDFGWQIASGANTTFTSDLAIEELIQSPEYQSLKNNVQNVGNSVGNTPLPSITVLHIGWLL